MPIGYSEDEEFDKLPPPAPVGDTTGPQPTDDVVVGASGIEYPPSFSPEEIALCERSIDTHQRLVGVVAEIRALHTEKLDHHFHAGEFFSQCAACGPKVRYPCATVQALDKAGCSQNSADAAEPKQPPRP